MKWHETYDIYFHVIQRNLCWVMQMNCSLLLGFETFCGQNNFLSPIFNSLLLLKYISSRFLTASEPWNLNNNRKLPKTTENTQRFRTRPHFITIIIHFSDKKTSAMFVRILEQVKSRVFTDLLLNSLKRTPRFSPGYDGTEKIFYFFKIM